MTKFSIIIPVFNSEQYLPLCIKTVLAQTFKDFEIVLINDGSIDSSPHICDDFAKSHNKIKVIHQSNQGAAAARNAGIKMSSGEYLIFLDSDDFYDDNSFFETVEAFIEKEKSPTAVSFPITKYYTKEKGIFVTQNKHFKESILNNQPISHNLQYQIANDCLPISASNTIIKREFVVKNGLFFCEKITGEDIEWSLRFYNICDGIRYLEINPYVYRKDNSQSVTQNITERNIRDIFNYVKKFSDQYIETDNLLSQLLLNYLAYQFVILLGLTSKIQPKQSRNKMRAEMKSYAFLLKYNLHPKVKLISKIHAIFGYKLTCVLLSLYICWRQEE